MREKPVVAIDGPSGVGKSTVARNVANRIGFSFIDTGALYRAVALFGRRHGIKWQDSGGLATMVTTLSFSFDAEGSLAVDGTDLGETIRTPEIALGASEVAAHEKVRSALIKIQRELGRSGGVVLEGRDIGTRVFEDAEIKFFLNASADVRAERRYLELVKKGTDVTRLHVLRDLEKRDKKDRTRPISPLDKADDALEIICDDMDVEQVTTLMIKYINSNFPLTSN